jgi:hypothetical protein
MKNIASLLICILILFAGFDSFKTQAAQDQKNKSLAALKKFKENKNSGWAYEPVKNPALPQIKDTKWPIRELDFFTLQAMEFAELSPAPDTNRETFIRRATLDAWGLVPSPAEVSAFKNDPSDNAYEKLIDRLLNSPQFGERQARRWLDLARYADSAGFESDDDRPNMWRYRDYVINSFNEDKSYDRFILEQIAGSELWPDSYSANIATGFLAGYSDSGGFRDLAKRKYEIENDMVSLVGETLLAASIGCAQCHDHKFDKISQRDYFRFQAFFSNSIAFEELPIAPDNQTVWDKTFNIENQKWVTATADIRAKQTAILDQVRLDAMAWRRERYFPSARKSLEKARNELEPMDLWIRHRADFIEVDGQIMRYLEHSVNEKDSAYNPKNIPLWTAYQKLNVELKKYDHLKPQREIPFYTSIKELGQKAPETYVRFGGIYERPLESVKPALPDLWAGKFEPKITTGPNTTGRRSALATWIANKSNPLTARVFVNRVWAQLFETGIAENVAEFGKAGPKPVNPQLLDHLAFGFMQNNWSVKTLFRNIMLSRTYRQSSAERSETIAKDPANRLLSVFPRKRLEAEQIRDSLLLVSGKLDPSIGGPAVFPTIPSSISKGNKFWKENVPSTENYRRSIYTFVRRSLPFAMTASFDPAEASSIHHRRAVSTTALQALTLLNSNEVFELSRALAGRVINEVGLNNKKEIDYLFSLLYSRSPSSKEKKIIQNFLSSQTKVIKEKPWSDTYSISVPAGVNSSIDPIRASAFLDLVHTLISSNDFIYRF